MASNSVGIKSIFDTYQGNGAWWAQCIMGSFGTIYYPKETLQEDRYFKKESAEIRATTPSSAFVYPNPSSGILNLVAPKSYEGADIVIHNMDGKVVINQKCIFGNNEVNLSEVKNGIYIIEVVKDKLSIFKSKWIKIQ